MEEEKEMQEVMGFEMATLKEPSSDEKDKSEEEEEKADEEVSLPSVCDILADTTVTKMWAENVAKAEHVAKDEEEKKEKKGCDWYDSSERMLKCTTCNMAWFKDRSASCKCADAPKTEKQEKPNTFDFQKHCIEKYEIEITKHIPKDTFTCTVTTRAGSFNKKFPAITIEMKPTETLGDFRHAAAFKIHEVYDEDTDAMMITTLKAESGFLFGNNMNETKLNGIAMIAGCKTTDDEMKFNMILDGYKEGGAKRVPLTEFYLY